MQNRSDQTEIKQEYADELEIHECELKTENLDDAPLMSEFEILVEPNEIKSECDDDLSEESIDSFGIKTEECVDEMSEENASEINIKTETYEEHSLKWENLDEETVGGCPEKSNNEEENYSKRETPFACEVCNKSFRSKNYLQYVHSRFHKGEKPFQCEVCSQSFIINSGLIRHSKIHAGERPFNCEICNKSFIRKFDLITHVKIHTGEKLFICEVCNKSFRRKTELNQHSVIHTGEKCFNCEVCSKSFKRKYHLSRHSRIHKM